MDKMTYKEMKTFLEQQAEKNYKNLIKVIISLESPNTKEEKLDEIYQYYMENDEVFLLSDELREKL